MSDRTVRPGAVAPVSPPGHSGRKRAIMRYDERIPVGATHWLVNRLHVSTPDEEIEADMRRRVAGRADWTPELVEQLVACALECHRENQKLYSDVMSGRI